MGLVHSTHRLKLKTGSLKFGKVFKVGLLCEKNSRHNRDGDIELNIQKDSIFLLLKDEYNLPDNIIFEWETIDTNISNGREPANIELNISNSNMPMKTPIKLIEKYHAVIGVGCPLFGLMHKQLTNMSGFVFNILKPFGLFAFFFNDKNNIIETMYNDESNQIKIENNFYRKKYYYNSTFSGPEFREISYDMENLKPIIYRTYIIFRKNAELINVQNNNISDNVLNTNSVEYDSESNINMNSTSNSNSNITSRTRTRISSRNRNAPTLPFTTQRTILRSSNRRSSNRRNSNNIPTYTRSTNRNNNTNSSLIIIIIIMIILLLSLYLLTLIKI